MRGLSTPLIRLDFYRPCPATWNGSTAIRISHTYDNLIWQWRITDHNGHRIEMIEGPRVVLVSQGHINRCPGRTDLHV